MKTADKQTIMTDIAALGYEVSAISDNAPMGTQLVTNADGSVTKVETTTITVTKSTNYSASA
jgi:hypothetical protein